MKTPTIKTILYIVTVFILLLDAILFFIFFYNKDIFLNHYNLSLKRKDPGKAPGPFSDDCLKEKNVWFPQTVLIAI